MASKTSELDDTDRMLVSALRRNARMAISDLAGELGVSRATIRSRMERLVASGEILGFTLVLRGDATEMPVRGITLIEIEGKGNERIVSLLRGFPEIQTIHSTNGRWDLIVEFGTETLADLDEALKRLRLIDGIVASETSLYLATQRSSKASAPASRSPG